MHTLCFFAVVCGQLTKGPENVAVLVGTNVTLRCAGYILGWDEYISVGGIEASAVSSEARVFLPNKYAVITEPNGTYDLIIKSAELKQGGRYRCKGLVNLASYVSAEVITFSGETLLLFRP